MTTCDPAPGAPNTCPLGYHCTPDGKCDALCTPTGNQCGPGNSCTSDGNCVTGDGGGGCTGLACNITDCDKMGMPRTTISGTVFAPNGKLPLYGVSVYVPNKDPGPFMAGAQCSKCSDPLPGNPIAQTTTDENGNFTLQNVPNGANIPLVITIGKWRRQIKIASVAACTTQMMTAADTTLPKSHDDLTPNTTSVDLPQIAISTGSADTLECLVRRLGIADKEITTDMGTGKIHLFSDTKAITNGNGFGASSFDNGYAGGTGSFSDSQKLWGSSAKLNNYDIVILSCEGDQHPETKPQAAMDNLKAYADLGGRVFLSHWHNIWLEGSTQHTNLSTAKPSIWAPDATKPGSGIASFVNNVDTGTGTVDTIDEASNPKGMAFADWMLKVGSTGIKRDQVPIVDGTGKHTATSIIGGKAERWVYWQSGTNQFPQNFQFTTPNEVSGDQRCGKVVFSDMHVSGNGTSGGSYPSSCGDAPPNPPMMLTDQEKALAFMFFDISSCVGAIL